MQPLGRGLKRLQKDCYEFSCLDFKLLDIVCCDLFPCVLLQVSQKESWICTYGSEMLLLYRFDPYSKSGFAICRICKSSVHQAGSHYCQGCAYKKGITSLLVSYTIIIKNKFQSFLLRYKTGLIVYLLAPVLPIIDCGWWNPNNGASKKMLYHDEPWSELSQPDKAAVETNDKQCIMYICQVHVLYLMAR